MTTIRLWITFAVWIFACQISVGPLFAHEWASAAALGDVFVGTQDPTSTPPGKPLIKVFGHGCASTSPPCVGALKEGSIIVGEEPGTIRGFALDTTPKDTFGQSQYNLYVAIDTGKIFKIPGTPPHTPVLFKDNLSQDIRSLKFYEDRNLYVAYGGVSPRIERYELASSTPTSPSAPHFVQCDVSPAPGLWFDLTARTLTGNQFAVYACGGTQIRSLDVLSTPQVPTTPYTVFATLPNLPGNTETARDLILLAPTDALVGAPKNSVREVQGGLVIAYGTNLQWLNRFGGVKGSFDFGAGSAAVNTWTSVTVSPTGGSVWGAAADRSFLTRFPLGSGFSSQPEVRFDTFSVPVTALIVNGVPNLAAAMQLIEINGVPATYLKSTRWEHSIKFEVFKAPPDTLILDTQYSSVRMAVTSFEGQTARQTDDTYPLFTDLSLDGRLARFPKTRAFKTSRGRGNYYRMVQQSSENISAVDVRVATSYIHEPFTQSVPFLTGLYDDLNHSDRGFLTAPARVNENDPEGPQGAKFGAVNLFDKNIRDEWFKTDSTARGSTRTSNDYMVGVQTGSAATLGPFRTSVSLGAAFPIRATYSFPVTPAFCNELVLTVARDGVPFVLVGSSLTTLNHLGEGIPYFAPTAANTCAANLNVEPNSSELPLPPNANGPDFERGRTYNFCVVYKDLEDLNTLPPNTTTPPSDVCGTFSVSAK